VAAILASQGIGLLVTLAILLTSGELLPSAGALLWASAAGLSGVVGLGAFYLALSRGTMGLIAPLAALIGAALPAFVAIWAGAELGAVRLAGIGLALAAVVLISLPGGEKSEAERSALSIDLRDLPLVLVSGLGFAGFYLFLDATAAAGGDTWWPLVVVRVVGLAAVLTALAVLVVRAGEPGLRSRVYRLLGFQRLRASGAGLLTVGPLFLLAGLGDLGGNAFFLFANALDALPVAVVLSSLYPVVTTVLAAVFLHERLRALQVLGIGLAVLAVILIGR
jgi:drug/metabolite transporter (DMT)-like permease